MAKSKRNMATNPSPCWRGPTGCGRRPGVIFGSDGLEGCEHAVFEILSNAIDEAREGYGKEIILTRFRDGRIQVEDFGRGCPVDWNEKVGKYNWELVFCELYAGGKYDNAAGDNYEYSLGLNGLGAAPPSMPPGLWTWWSAGTASGMTCILKREAWWER